jgi:hypothetical protein
MPLVPNIGAIFTPLTDEVFDAHREIRGNLSVVKINGVFRCFCVKIDPETAYSHPTLFHGLSEDLHGTAVCVHRDGDTLFLHPREKHSTRADYDTVLATASPACLKPVSIPLFIAFIRRLYDEQKRFCDNYIDDCCPRGRTYLDPHEAIFVGDRAHSAVALCPECLKAAQDNPDPNNPPTIALDGRLIPFQGPLMLWVNRLPSSF